MVSRLSSFLALAVLLASFLMTAVVGAPGHFWQTKYRDPMYTDDTFVGIINATPYRWRRGYFHSYQMSGWENDWPAYINPGESVEALSAILYGSNGYDCAAEMQYDLEGTSKPMALRIEYRQESIWIRFMYGLETVNNAPESVHQLGLFQRPGGVGFLLAGSEETGLISNDGPPDWMHRTLPTIGHLPLRALALPRSHHAGMWKAVAPIGAGSPGNTLCQVDDLWRQLTNGGIRVLDVRPTMWHWHFRESHASPVGILGWQGMFGAAVEEMIDIVNRFTDEHPGELIIWDVHPDARHADHGFRELNSQELGELYDLFRLLRHRISVPDDEDLTQWPLERFIGNGTTAVLIRVRESWLPRGGDFPGGREGFVTERNFPVNGRWSNVNDDQELIRDQLEHLRQNRPHRDTTVWNAEWLITQHAEQVFWPDPNIPKMNQVAWRSLYHEFWNALTEDTYPNWITMDRVHRNQQRTMAMAINHCLAARQCGTLGGKVKSLDMDAGDDEVKTLDADHGNQA